MVYLIYQRCYDAKPSNPIHIRDVIDMVHIDISITPLKQYSLLSLVSTHINVSKCQKNLNGLLEKKLRAEYCWCCLSILSESISLQGPASLFCCVPNGSKN